LVDETPEAALESLKSELDYEILEMKRVLAPRGHVVWRSAGKYPWYIERFELAGFEVEAVDIREGGKAIDRVNFYASLYRAKKIA
jgi:betaine lipid synthase